MFVKLVLVLLSELHHTLYIVYLCIIYNIFGLALQPSLGSTTQFYKREVCWGRFLSSTNSSKIFYNIIIQIME
jgi:hypothetical protein